MARYLGPKEKIERRIGEKLFLKGERSLSPKSAVVKKPYPPGMHGRRPVRKTSEYGMQLRSKQKVKNMYRLLEKQFKGYMKAVLESKQEPYVGMVHKLELRLDNVVYRMGLAQSRDQARQLVNHGHILVNGRKVSIPSFQVSTGDIVSVREGSQRSPFFTALAPQWLKNYEAPEWIEMDKTAMKATIKAEPDMVSSGIRGEDLQAIIEFYSR